MQSILKYSVKAFIFVTLLVLYYCLYMKPALEQYNRGSTTIGERNEMVDQIDYPVFIICPEPGFKQSFFEKSEERIRNLAGVKDYVWKYTKNRQILLENASSIPDLYMEMSYKLGVDWKVLILDDTVNDE